MLGERERKDRQTDGERERRKQRYRVWIGPSSTSWLILRSKLNLSVVVKDGYQSARAHIHRSCPNIVYQFVTDFAPPVCSLQSFINLSRCPTGFTLRRELPDIIAKKLRRENARSIVPSDVDIRWEYHFCDRAR